jgi:hypothetical protein
MHSFESKAGDRHAKMHHRAAGGKSAAAKPNAKFVTERQHLRQIPGMAHHPARLLAHGSGAGDPHEGWSSLRVGGGASP